MKTSIEVTSSVTAPCPFCKGEYTLAISKSEDSVLHTLPPCKQYMELDAMEFVKQARLQGEFCKRLRRR